MTEHQQLVWKNRGKFYNDVRSEIHKLDWDGVYPVVDADGALTGAVADARNRSFTIVDVTSEQLIAGWDASDAMILTSEFLQEDSRQPLSMDDE